MTDFIAKSSVVITTHCFVVPYYSTIKQTSQSVTLLSPSFVHVNYLIILLQFKYIIFHGCHSL